MKRKTYQKHVRALMAGIRKWGYGSSPDTRGPYIRFGAVIDYGKFKGQKLDSYKMAYELLKELFPDMQF